MTKPHLHDAFVTRFKFADGTEWAVCRFAGCCYSIGDGKTNPVKKHSQSVEPVFDEAVDGVIDEPQDDVVVSELSVEQMSFADRFLVLRPDAAKLLFFTYPLHRFC